MTRKTIIFATKIIISITALIIIGSQLNIKSVLATVASAKVSLLVLAFLLALLQPAINAVKIKLLLPGSSIPYQYVLFTNFASNFIRLTIPTDIGAELGRGYYLSRRTGSPAAAFSAIVLDRYFGFCSQAAVITVVSLASGFSGDSLFWKQVGIAGATVLLAAVTALVLFYKMPTVKPLSRKGLVRVTSAIAKLSEALHVFKTMPFRLVSVGAVSIVAITLALLMTITLSAAFREPLAFREASVITFLSTIACLLPSLAGLGFVEGVFAGMFHYFSLHKEIGFTVSLTLRIFTVVLALPGMLFIIAGDRGVKKNSGSSRL